MMIFSIPFRYAKAKWVRTTLQVAVFALGVASMVGLHLVSTVIGDSFEKKLISYGANILVTPKRETLKVNYGGYTLGDVTLEEHWISLSEAKKSIDAMPLRANVAIIAPKMLATTRIAGQAVAIVGVDWDEEAALKGYWEVEGALPKANAQGEVVLGATLAQKLGIAPLQTITVGNNTLQVRGVLKATGGDDDNVMFASLQFIQQYTGKVDQAAFLEVAALCSGCPIEDIVEQLQHALPDTEVRALRQVAESRMYSVHFAQNLAFYVSLVILITACAMLIMSMLSSVTERYKEIGIMRAVGFSRLSIFVVFASEALGIGIMAGVVGHLSGYILANYVLSQLHLADTTTLIFSYSSFFATIGAVGVVAGLAAAFPAWKASLVEPADALVAL